MLFIYFSTVKTGRTGPKNINQFLYNTLQFTGHPQASSKSPGKFGYHSCFTYEESKSKRDCLGKATSSQSLGFATLILRAVAELGCLPGLIHNHFPPGQKRLLNGTAMLHNQQTRKGLYSEADECSFKGCFLCWVFLTTQQNTINYQDIKTPIFYFKCIYWEGKYYLSLLMQKQPSIFSYWNCFTILRDKEAPAQSFKFHSDLANINTYELRLEAHDCVLQHYLAMRLDWLHCLRYCEGLALKLN